MVTKTYCTYIYEYFMFVMHQSYKTNSLFVKLYTINLIYEPLRLVSAGLQPAAATLQRIKGSWKTVE